MKKALNHEYEIAKKETIKFWQTNKDYILAILFIAVCIVASINGLFN
jgi:hypothetical protein